MPFRYADIDYYVIAYFHYGREPILRGRADEEDVIERASKIDVKTLRHIDAVFRCIVELIIVRNIDFFSLDVKLRRLPKYFHWWLFRFYW